MGEAAAVLEAQVVVTAAASAAPSPFPPFRRRVFPTISLNHAGVVGPAPGRFDELDAPPLSPPYG
jgi:hypothetical protein